MLLDHTILTISDKVATELLKLQNPGSPFCAT